MEKKKKIASNKALEYPVIYSYIYERESEDIKRLARKFKGFRKNKAEASPKKVIIGYKIEGEKAIPIYKEPTSLEKNKKGTIKDAKHVLVEENKLSNPKIKNSGKKKKTQPNEPKVKKKNNPKKQKK